MITEETPIGTLLRPIDSPRRLLLVENSKSDQVLVLEVNLEAEPKLWNRHLLEPVPSNDGTLQTPGLSMGVYQHLYQQFKLTLDRANTAEAKLESVNDALIEEAIRREWCDDFETFAEANGLRGCSREFDVSFSVRMRFNHVVVARNAREAHDMIDEDRNEITSKLVESDYANADWDMGDVEVFDVEAAS